MSAQPNLGMQVTTFENPMGINGFEFVEFAAPPGQGEAMADYLRRLGFTAIAKHRSRAITLFRQGGINFLLNEEPDSFAADFAAKHGRSACGFAIRFRKKPAEVLEHVLANGGEKMEHKADTRAVGFPVIKGIGDCMLYLIDDSAGNVYADYEPIPGVDQHPRGFGLTFIDHLTHNLYLGNMQKWSDYYEKLFNFREIRYFDIEGQKTGLFSRAMTSPCGRIRIPINESQDDKSQIEEYLREYRGEGIQHIALGTDDIFATVDVLRGQGVQFQDTPETYYEAIDARVPGHGEKIEEMRKRRILIDGNPEKGEGLLLQIFTQNVIGPIFFEIIQRKGNEGFGEGNFKALFESIELDQMRRGVI